MEKKRIWELGRDSVETYREKRKLPLVLVVDNVRSLNNIGAMFRTADAFLVERMALCGISSPPPSPEIHKTALGAEETVAWEYYADTMDAVAKLRADGYTICCLEQVKGSVALQDFKVSDSEKYAIVVGNEVDGVDQRVVDASDVALEIPQYGTKHSLNVSVSAALSLWQFFIQLT
ncbi:MAG: RNA methyltransferase [Muribaculaceae bacterium]|nr:RNA methyltransferase [Muribaculaceae bacterium]MDE6610290.1 RNA methyltransferase [Muribaculaceae bacterium]